MPETSICISTVIYPGVEQGFSNFLGSVGMQKEKPELLVFNHGADFQYENTIEADSLFSIAQVRAFMFSYLKNYTDADVYVFTDSDDKLYSQAIQNHLKALENADFSYGDQHLYLEDFSNDLGLSLFGIMDPPKILTCPNDLLKGNCVGLSALAMSRNCLVQVPDVFPEDMPLLDWWLALTLLEQGMTGSKAGIVTEYCLSKAAYERIFPAKTLEELSNRVEIVMKLLEVLGSCDGRIINRIKKLQSAIKKDTELIEKYRKEVSEEKMMWYQDVFDISKKLQALK